jgi:predicted RNase H-like nuclease (RuvC/YqgF family)
VEQKNSKIYNKESMQTLSAYCSANNIEDIDDFIYKCFKQGFDIKKYGLLGKTLNDGEKHLKTGGIEEKQVEIEVIREIRVEVPVEVIKEVEKIVEVSVEVIKEVPVEKVVIQEVIKEVPVDRVVEKIIQTSDDTQINELLSKIDQLNGEISIKCFEIDNIRQEFSTKTEEMENIFQNKMSKKDEELDELRRNLDIPVTNDRLNMLQQTIQNLNSEIRDLKKKNEELEKKLLEQPKESDFTRARFHGSSNLNDGLYK